MSDEDYTESHENDSHAECTEGEGKVCRNLRKTYRQPNYDENCPHYH